MQVSLSMYVSIVYLIKKISGFFYSKFLKTRAIANVVNTMQYCGYFPGG